MATAIKLKGSCFVSWMIRRRMQILRWRLGDLAAATQLNVCVLSRSLKSGRIHSSNADKCIYAMGGVPDDETGSIRWDDHLVLYVRESGPAPDTRFAKVDQRSSD